MQDLEKSPPDTPAGVAIVKTGRERWQSVFKQLQMWSSAIDYDRVRGNDRQTTQALIESIEHVALRLASAEHARRKSVDAVFEPLREPFDRLYHVCVESFQLIENSLADMKPVPDLPDTGSLIRDIESRGGGIRRSAAGDEDVHANALRVMSVTAHMHLLAKALHDCRDKVNALDWQAWNRNYL